MTESEMVQQLIDINTRLLEKNQRHAEAVKDLASAVRTLGETSAGQTECLRRLGRAVATMAARLFSDHEAN